MPPGDQWEGRCGHFASMSRLQAAAAVIELPAASLSTLWLVAAAATGRHVKQLLESIRTWGAPSNLLMNKLGKLIVIHASMNR